MTSWTRFWAYILIEDRSPSDVLCLKRGYETGKPGFEENREARAVYALHETAAIAEDVRRMAARLDQHFGARQLHVRLHTGFKWFKPIPIVLDYGPATSFWVRGTDEYHRDKKALTGA